MLRLKEHWLNHIMHHNKTCEVRGCTARTGPLWSGGKGLMFVHATIDRVEEVGMSRPNACVSVHRRQGKLSRLQGRRQGDALRRYSAS